MPFVNTDILINTILKVNKCDKDSTFHLFGTFRIDKINMNIDTQIVYPKRKLLPICITI